MIQPPAPPVSRRGLPGRLRDAATQVILLFVLLPVAHVIVARSARCCRGPFVDTSELPWVKEVEARWRDIRDELALVLEHREQAPLFQQISPDQAVITADDRWRTFGFYAYGHRFDANCAVCPTTAAVLERMPGMTSAMFSILAPGKHIPEHRGPFNGVLRYHLGLIVPRQKESCRIRVGGEWRAWSEGESLIFDDTYPHEVRNDTDEERVVLFVDVARPLPGPVDRLNRLLIRLIGRSSFVRRIIERVEQHAAGGNPAARHA